MAKRISLIIIALTILSLITPPYTTHAEGSTTIQVAPSTTTVASGTTFTLDVTVTGVTDVAVWEFRMFYLNTVLNCTNITEGPLLKTGGSTFFDSTIRNAYNATHDWLLAGSTLLGQVPGVNGTGTLATITFQTIAAGDTPLQFSNDPLVTFLLDSSPPPRHSIPFVAVDGTVHVTVDHDVAVTNIASYKTIISQGYSGNITVTTANKGDYAETFNVTAYANATVVTAIANVDLAGGSSTVQTVVWNTAGFAYGNYTMSAYAWPVPGETNTQDNNLTSPITIMVTMPGDLMQPFGTVDMRDISYVAKRFGATPSAPLPHSLAWDPNADIDDSGKVDLKDIAIVAKNFGKHYS